MAKRGRKSRAEGGVYDQASVYRPLRATPEQAEARRLKFAKRIENADKRKRKKAEAKAREVRLLEAAGRCACGCGNEAGFVDPPGSDNSF